MLRTQLYLPKEQMKYLKETAYREDISISEAVRRTIKEQITRRAYAKKGFGEKQKKTGSWLLSLAKKAKQLGFKDSKDLAANMDEYLYDQDFR